MVMGAQKIGGSVNKSIFINLELSPIFAPFSLFLEILTFPINYPTKKKKKVRKIIHSRNFTVWPNSGECWILSSHIQLHCYKANACLPIHTDFLCPFCA